MARSNCCSNGLSPPEVLAVRIRANCITLIVLIVAAFPAVAADFATGLDALDQRNYAIALQEFTPLAAAGNARAQFRLGTMYAMGLGVARDYAKAAGWLEKAAVQGYARAQNDLGVLYELGRGVAQDPNAAARLFRQAAEHGVGAAQLSLARLYRDGRGLPKDLGESYAWADTATQLGELSAQRLLDSLVKDMTVDEIDRARRLAQRYERQYVAPFRTY
jgi:TPR repeat protein